MRNGVALAVIRKEVRIEAGFSTDAGHSIYSDERLDQMINRTERQLSQTYDWPNMEFEEEVTVPAGARYVNLPTNINFTMIDTAHVKSGDEWLPIYHGISPCERTIYNETQRAEPIRRWDIEAPGDVNFEVWPVGGSDQTILFSGTKSFGSMDKDNDTCVLDADVIVMIVASQILGRDQREDAALMLQNADQLMNAIIKRQGAAKREDIALGRKPRKQLRPGIDYIPPGWNN